MAIRRIEAPQGLIKLFKDARDFREIQQYFIRLTKQTSEKLQNVTIITQTEVTPGAEQDELFCDTDGGDITVNLPQGPNGKQYRIVNVGTSGNRVLLVPVTGVKLLGSTDSDYLADYEAAILTFQSPEDWY